MTRLDQVFVVKAQVLEDEDQNFGKRVEHVTRVDQSGHSRSAAHDPQQTIAVLIGCAVAGSRAQRRKDQDQPSEKYFHLA